MTDSPDLPPAPDVDVARVDEIADGVWVVPDRRVPLVPNIGLVEGDAAVLVVDTGMGPRNGERVLQAARERAAGRRLLLTLTHFHPEHGFGAQAFHGEASIVYNARQADELREKGEAYVGMFRTFGPTVEAALEGVELVPPDETYEGTTTLDLGGRTVTLRETGLAHTRGDQLVTVDDAGVVFAGDLVEEACFPIFPYFPPDDVDVAGSAWIDVLTALEAAAPRLVVPGHGAVGDVGVVATQRTFMEALRSRAYEAADAGLDADTAVERLEATLTGTHPDWAQPEWVAFGIRCFHAERLDGRPSTPSR